jgi:hypothetical protein
LPRYYASRGGLEGWIVQVLGGDVLVGGFDAEAGELA